ncbi:hypothetical protein [Ancylobacter polymorphus]|uniref:Uncharacterized protein n=1 Tax=Ancylobacter polymorphus TaxID=223390 RepID=A0ABU0B923_9HYPH|nr:hypothetical protein [Ancylobacter polymorphus]MDQ0302327.1 hypothetical protein [Ancylobacter polymorphus]MPT24558.1 hypothetical protein [Starkeya sp.]
MKGALSELSAWLQANGLNPADFRLRLEAKTITAQRDALKAFKTEVEPHLAPPAAPHRKGTLNGVEISVEGPLHGF